MMPTRLSVVILTLILLGSGAADPVLTELVSGRIVMYDWTLHELTNNDEFIVKVISKGSTSPEFLRVIYRVNWGWDAPSSSASERLDRLAFVGRGAIWDFDLSTPQTEEERKACNARIVPHRFEDEEGSGTLPRYVATPGGQELLEPQLQTLPCRILLKRNGMSREK